METTSEETCASDNIIDVFKEALADDDVEVQMGAIKSLPAMAVALDLEKTRNLLLPYLLQNITEVNDEMQICAAEQLRKFIPLVGGTQHVDIILQILVKMCITDETLVRERAVEAIRDITGHLDDGVCESVLVPLIHDLSTGEWFTNKCSATALFSVCYPKVSNDEKKELRDIYRNLAQDESPMVRKAAATNLPGFLNTLDPEHIKMEFMPVFDNIATDFQDSVKIMAVDVGISIAERVETEECKDQIFAVIEGFSKDESWKMRHKVASSIDKIQDALGANKHRGKILNIYQNLAKDSESEVRIVAIGNLFKYCKSLKENYERNQCQNNFEPVFQESILPLIRLTLDEQSEEILLAASKNILQLCSLLSSTFFETHILPLIVEALEKDLPIRFKEDLIRNLDLLPSSINLSSYMESIKKAIHTIVMDSKLHWRTRRSIVIAFIHIGKYTSKEYFESQMRIYYFRLLDDPIFAVRRTASVILPLLAEIFSMKWTVSCILPTFMSYANHARYLYRYIPLNCINELLYPSVEKSRNSQLPNYLEYFKSRDSETDIKILAKLKYLNGKLINLLSTDAYMEVLSSLSSEEFIEENVQIYAEDTLNILRKTRKESVFALSEDKMKKNEICYLEGILQMCNTTFLPVLLSLSKDSILNVQLFTRHTMSKVQEFAKSLEKELLDPWVQEKIDKLSGESYKEVENCISTFNKDLPLDLGPKGSLDEAKTKNMIITGSEEPLPELGAEVLDLEINDNLSAGIAGDLDVASRSSSRVAPRAASEAMDVIQEKEQIVGNLEQEIMDELQNKPSSI